MFQLDNKTGNGSENPTGFGDYQKVYLAFILYAADYVGSQNNIQWVNPARFSSIGFLTRLRSWKLRCYLFCLFWRCTNDAEPK